MGRVETQKVSAFRPRALGKIALAFFLILLAFAGLAYAFRFTIAAWYLNGSRQAGAMVVSTVADKAPPVIEQELHMTIPQSILSFFMGRRGEETRERDALKDAETFTEQAFKNHWLRFRDVHGRGSIKGFDLGGSDVALMWVRAGDEDVLAAFHVDLWKKKASGIRVNEKSGFFAELTQYVSRRARKN
jgi:hypothetical protein